MPNAEVISATQKVIDAGIPVVAINSGFSVAESMGMTFFAGMHEIQAGVRAADFMIAAGVTNPIFVGHGSTPDIPIERVQYDAPGWERDRWIGFNRTFVEKMGIHPQHIGIAGLDYADQKNNVSARLVNKGIVGGVCTSVRARDCGRGARGSGWECSHNRQHSCDSTQFELPVPRDTDMHV